MADLCFDRIPVDMPPCWISGGFGEDYGGYLHRGVDIAGPYGTPIYAPATGRRVSLYNPDGSFGYAIVLDHEGTPWYSILAHMAYPPIPAMGELILSGSLVGYMDSTGTSSGNHVHWQVSNSIYFPPDISTCIDPLSIMCPEDDMTPAEVQQMIDSSIAPLQAQMMALASQVQKMGTTLNTLNDAMVKREDIRELASGPIDNVRNAWDRLLDAGNLQPGDTGGPQPTTATEMVGASVVSPRARTQSGDEGMPPFQTWRGRGESANEDERPLEHH